MRSRKTKSLTSQVNSKPVRKYKCGGKIKK